MTTFDEAAGTRPSTPAEATRNDPHRLPDVFGLVVGILGGTGPQGRGLAYRAAGAGQQVIIGSGDAARAASAAADIGPDVRGADNATTARESDLVIVATPWEGHAELLATLRDELAGKIVVDCVNPSASTRREPTHSGPRRAAPPSRLPRCCLTPG